jgi:hypothetical protein
MLGALLIIAGAASRLYGVRIRFHAGLQKGVEHETKLGRLGRPEEIAATAAFLT